MTEALQTQQLLTASPLGLRIPRRIMPRRWRRKKGGAQPGAGPEKGDALRILLAAFDSKGYAELICDGLHVSPEMVAMTYRNIGLERLVLITDSMAAAGFPDGDYNIAGSPAIVRDGIARTQDGALAGSTLSLVLAVENLARFCNISISDALVCATLNPAAELGVSDQVGELKRGARADILLASIDESAKKLRVDRVFVGGKEVE